jgi:hypothetical protein
MGKRAPKKPAPFRIAIEPARGESLVEHLARNADRLALGDEQKRRLAEAYRLWGDDDDGRTAMTRGGERAEATGIALAVQTELAGAIGESVDLEQARGGGQSKVQRLTGGRTRLCNRDGLMLLYDSGALTGLTGDQRAQRPTDAPEAWMRAAVRMAAGLAYREHAEHLAGDLRSNLNSIGGVGGGSNTAAKAAVARAKASLIVDRIDREVQMCIRSPKAIQALRMVAGEARTVRSMVPPGGKNVDLTVAALIKALDVAAHLLRVPGHAVLT